MVSTQGSSRKEAMPPIPPPQEETRVAYVAKWDQFAGIVAAIALAQTLIAICLAILQTKTNAVSPLLLLVVSVAPYIAFLLAPIAIFLAAPYRNPRQRTAGIIGVTAILAAWLAPYVCSVAAKLVP